MAGDLSCMTEKIPEKDLNILKNSINGVLYPEKAKSLSSNDWNEAIRVIYDACVSCNSDNVDYINDLLVNSISTHFTEIIYPKLKDFYSKLSDFSDEKEDGNVKMFFQYSSEYRDFQKKFESLICLFNIYIKHYCKCIDNSVKYEKYSERHLNTHPKKRCSQLWGDKVVKPLIVDCFFPLFVKLYKKHTSDEFISCNFGKLLFCYLTPRKANHAVFDYFVQPAEKTFKSEYVLVGFDENSPDVYNKERVGLICKYYEDEKIILNSLYGKDDANYHHSLSRVWKYLVFKRFDALLEYMVTQLRSNNFNNDLSEIYYLLCANEESNTTVHGIVLEYFIEYVTKVITDFISCPNNGYKNLCELIIATFTRFETFINIISKAEFKEHLDIMRHGIKGIVSVLDSDASNMYGLSKSLAKCIDNIMRESEISDSDLSKILQSNYEPIKESFINFVKHIEYTRPLVEYLTNDMSVRLLTFSGMQIKKEEILATFIMMNFTTNTQVDANKMVRDYASREEIAEAASAEKKFKQNSVFIENKVWPIESVKDAVEPVKELSSFHAEVEAHLKNAQKTMLKSNIQEYACGKLSFTIKDKTYNILCDFVTLNILLYFNEKNSTLKSRLLRDLKIEEQLCDRYMKVLIELGLVYESGANEFLAFNINKEFTHDSTDIDIRKLTVGFIQSKFITNVVSKTSHSDSANLAAKDLTYPVRCRIMSILKDEYSNTMSELFETLKNMDVFRTCSDEFITIQLEYLIDNQYLKKKDDLVQYIY